MPVLLRTERSGVKKLDDSDKRWLLKQQGYQCKCGIKLSIRNAIFESMLPYADGRCANIHDMHVICLGCNSHATREKEMSRLLREYIEQNEPMADQTITQKVWANQMPANICISAQKE